jgi:hypothetical protein
VAFLNEDGDGSIFFLFKHGLSCLVLGLPVRNMGIMQEYNERKNKKLINNLLVTDT